MVTGSGIYKILLLQISKITLVLLKQGYLYEGIDAQAKSPRKNLKDFLCDFYSPKQFVQYT
jgi:hypothetical protein